MKWKQIIAEGITPELRHGHRAVTNGDFIYFFGGGDRKICENSLNVYNIKENFSFTPKTSGSCHPGCANHGMVFYNNMIIIFGGMMEYGKYSNELYTLHIPTFHWKKFSNHAKDLPSPRMGHSFTLTDDHRIFVFGGLINSHPNPKKDNIPKYMNDIYTLHIMGSEKFKWKRLPVHSNGPCERESHSANFYHDKRENRKFIIIFGGMNGRRLGDVWFYDLVNHIWVQYEIKGLPATPRSLHTSCMIGKKLYIFGGWVEKFPLPSYDNPELCDRYETTNLLSYIDLEKMEWNHFNDYDEVCPGARAGHSMVSARNRLYLWSGRTDFDRDYNYTCLDDFWYLETEVPRKIEQINLTRASQSIFELKWDNVQNADCYLLEIHKIQPTQLDLSKIRIKPNGQKEEKVNQVIFIQNKRKSDELEEPKDKKHIVDKNNQPTVQEDIVKTIATEKIISPLKIVKPDDKRWLTVGIFNKHECIIDGYYSIELNRQYLDYETCPNHDAFDNKLKIRFSLDTMYAFRVCGINISGVGENSKIFNFKTLDNAIPPPSVPNNCKFIPTLQGVRLAWTPNPLIEKVTSYSVYIASSVESAKNIKFMKIYDGEQPTCHVPKKTIDQSYHQILNNLECVIFRITATNALGNSSAPLMITYNYP